MPAKRAHKPKSDISDEDSDGSGPSWDSTDRNLMAYLLLLVKAIPRKFDDAKTFVKYGYILDRNGKMVMADSDH